MPSLLTAVTLFASVMCTTLAQASVFEDFRAEYESAQTATYGDLPYIKEPNLKEWKCVEAYPDYSQGIERNPPVLFKKIRVLNQPNLEEEFALESTSVASLVCRTDKKYSLALTSNFRLLEEDMDFKSATPQEIETSCRIGSISRSVETVSTASEMSQTDYEYLPDTFESKSFRASDTHLYMKVDWTTSNETTTSIMKCTPPQVRNLQKKDSQYEVKLEADTSPATAVWYKLGVGGKFDIDINSRTFLWLSDAKIPGRKQVEFERMDQLADTVNAILYKGQPKKAKKDRMAFRIPSPKRPSQTWTTPNPDIPAMMRRLCPHDPKNSAAVAWAERCLQQKISSFGIMGPATRAIGDYEDRNSRPNVDRKVSPGDCLYSSGRELNRVGGKRIIECDHLTPSARGKMQYR